MSTSSEESKSGNSERSDVEKSQDAGSEQDRGASSKRTYKATVGSTASQEAHGQSKASVPASREADHVGLSKDLNTFRVFTWMSAVHSSSSTQKHSETRTLFASMQIDDEKLTKTLKSINDFLLNNKRTKEQSAYRRGPQSTYDGFDTAVSSRIESLKQKLAEAGNNPTDDEDEIERIKDELQGVMAWLEHGKAFFECFIPLKHGSEIASKYWGALAQIVSVMRALNTVRWIS